MVRASLAFSIALLCSPVLARPPDSAGGDQVVTIPVTSSGKQLRWVLRMLNEEEKDQSGEQVAEHFTDSFLEQVSVEAVTKELADIRSSVYDNKKVRAVSVDQGERDDTMTAVLAAKGVHRYLSVFIIVDDKSNKIAGLRFEPAGGGAAGGETPNPTRGGSWDEMDKAIEEMEGDVSFGCYELVPRDAGNPGGEFVLMDIAAKNENRALAIGSTFKLYVLGAIAEDVAAGKGAWTDLVEIRDDMKSLPSGTMQLLPEGTKKPVADFAMQMISISDNTAADHLIRHAGRERGSSWC